MDNISTDVLALRALQTRLLARFRCECIYQINDKLKDYEIAKLLGISATAFSLASTGVSTLSGPTFYRLLCALIGLGVNVICYFEDESFVLDFIQKTNSEHPGELFKVASGLPDKFSNTRVEKPIVIPTDDLFNDSSAPPTGANEAASGCPVDCHGECSYCVNG